MKRKIYQQLIDWKLVSNGKSALLIEGARRIGKSYIVELNPKSYTTSNKKLTFLQNYLRIPFIFTNFAR